jgi:hypothetical protein
MAKVQIEQDGAKGGSEHVYTDEGFFADLMMPRTKRAKGMRKIRLMMRTKTMPATSMGEAIMSPLASTEAWLIAGKSPEMPERKTKINNSFVLCIVNLHAIRCQLRIGWWLGTRASQR